MNAHFNLAQLPKKMVLVCTRFWKSIKVKLVTHQLLKVIIDLALFIKQD